MSKTYRLSLVLLSAAVVFALSDSRSAFSQRFRSGGSDQGSSEKKKDKDDDDKKDKKRDQGNQGQGGNQGNNQGGNNQGSNKQGDNQNSNQGNNKNNQNQGNNSNSGNSKKSGNSNVPSEFQPFIQGQGGKNQKDKDKDKDKNDNQNQPNKGQGQNNQGPFNQGQGGSNKNNQNQPNFPGKGGQQPLVIQGGAGNAEPANRKLGKWQGDRWEGTRKADNWTRAFGVNQQLFGSQWYKDHPKAWKYNNDRTNVWVVATVPGVYSWLGWGAVPQQYTVGYGPVERFDPTRYGDWYPLGVYSLMSGGDDIGTRVVQLAVDRHGHINGNYFDMITNDNNSIAGEVDRDSQRVTFWLDRNPNVHFHASVYRLLQQPYGSITVHLPGAEQRWQFVRLED